MDILNQPTALSPRRKRYLKKKIMFLETYIFSNSALKFFCTLTIVKSKCSTLHYRLGFPPFESYIK